MTPERQKWWDSLPTEEKRVREDIDEFKRMIRHNKKHLIPYVAFAKYCIRYSKKAIKALRKQIAMRPITKRANGDDYRKCPHCGRYLWRIEEDIYYDYPPKYCEDCGQKLRWA